MRLRPSLFTKIWLWFLLNLVLVGTVLFGFFAFQSRVDLHSILGHEALDRLRIAGKLISRELYQTPSSAWREILTRYQEIHQVDFALVLLAGPVYASNGLSVPQKVIDRVAQTPPQGYKQPFLKDSRNIPGRRNRSEGQPSVFFRARDASGNRNDEKGDDRRLLIRTKNPPRYWTGIWVFVPGDQRQNVVPAMLLAASDSISGHGFFFNPRPWVVAVSAVILLSVVLWIPLVRHITQPLHRMTRASEEIARGRFDTPIREVRRDEIGRLSSAIDHMTRRLRGYVEGQRAFLRDVAHELGSPIARIQLGLGILEQHVDQTNRDRLADVAEDVDHMAHLVNELLSFSRAEASSENINLTTVPLAPIIQKVVRREGMAAEEIITDIPSGFKVTADARLLSRAIANVVRNAITYGGQSGPIHISAIKNDGIASIEIRDSGPGVPGNCLERIFEPFFRPETHRDRQSGGVGLGLSIVKTCMEACDGGVSARNLDPRGFSVTLTLPLPA